jgi:stress response protein SCP2
MSVNLQKGQKVDLTKGNSGLKRVMVGLGWDEVQPEKTGLFSRKPEDIDCDASAILIGPNGRLSQDMEGVVIKDVVFYNHLNHPSRAIIHQGDNLTGGGDGDDEQILVDLANLPQQYSKVVFVVTIYKAKEKRQHFGMIRNAFIRLVDADTNNELMKYNLSENYDNMTAMIFGEVYRHDGEWKFNAIGQPTTDNSISDMWNRYF